MLSGLSSQIAYCYQRANECRELAALSVSESDQQFYFEREQGWLKLAHSYELSERVARVINELERRGRLMPTPRTQQALPNCPSCGVAMNFKGSFPAKGIGAQATTAIEVTLFVCPDCGRMTDEVIESRL
jgi:predicted RNA-binding Zn-ribbon protein involved in translation (DUF1610 family)